MLEVATRGIDADKVRELRLSDMNVTGSKTRDRHVWTSRLLEMLTSTFPRFFDLSEGHRESGDEGRGEGKGR